MAGSRYVEVSREALLGALKQAGFSESTTTHRGELVYYRQHHVDPTMMVKVYTSLPRHASSARACGEDAIRVLLVFERPARGALAAASGCLYKASRVYRTGSEQGVIDRTLERARECYGEANKRLAQARQGRR